jgi:protein TonB
MNANYSNTSMLDMVFEHRNKAYGAYVLRRDANKSVQQAMLSILSLVTLLCFGNFIKENMRHRNNDPKPMVTVVTTSDVNKVHTTPPAKKIQPPPPPQHSAAPIATAANPEKKVVADNKAPEDSIPATKDLANLESGIKANPNGSTGLGVTDGTGKDQTLELAQQVQPATREVFPYSEIMPEFPGGEKALMAFIGKHTEYPDMERQNEIGGKVITQFTVNEDGSVSDIQILRSPSKGFNKEVDRVIKLLPHFKPGLQQGRPVRVRYVLPIVFNVKD